MLFRASSEMAGTRPDLQAVTAGSDVDPGIDAGVPLLQFADAVIGRDPAAITRAREALVAAVGPTGAVDAAGVVGNFERMNRIADAIGIPQDAPMLGAVDDISDQLGLRRFASASHSAEPSGLQRMLGAVIRKLLPYAARIAARAAAREG